MNRIQTNVNTYFTGDFNITQLNAGDIDLSSSRSSFFRSDCFTVSYTYCSWDGGENPVGDACYNNPDGGDHVITVTQTYCFDGGADETISDPDGDTNGGGTSDINSNALPLTPCDTNSGSSGLEGSDGTCLNEIEVNLNNELEDNPFKLIEIDCNQIQNWQTLAQHEAPSSVQNKVNNLPSSFFNNFEIQSLEDANGIVVNMDYFPVTISTLPNNPITGQQYTADEFLDYFRRNINDFVDGSGSSFEPYCEIPSMCQTETDLWNSNNPLGAVVYINIPADDGVIICTEYTNSYWYFMTMNAPYAGNHPVSGTRQFGYEQNVDGSYNFFVRGVDRFNSLIHSGFADYVIQTDPFILADNLWYTFQENMKDFVNNNGGAANVGTDSTNRPDWQKVKDVLLGNRPKSDLGCN